MPDNRSTYSPRSRNVSGGQGGSGRASHAAKPGRRRMSPRGALVVLLLAAAAAGVIIYLGIAPLYSGNMARGVMISGVDVSGMSASEALAKLSEHAVQKMDTISVTISHEGRTWKYGASELSAQIDLSQIVNRAIAVGNTGDMKQRRIERRDAAAGRYQFDMDVALTAEKLVYYLNLIKDEIDIPVVEPGLTLDCAGPRYTIEGYNYYQPGVDYTVLFKTSPGQTGSMVDVEATLQLINQDLADDNIADVQLVVNRVAPQSTEQDILPTLLFHSTSKLRGSTDNRNTNIEKALSNFDGMVIAPDQIVSFNETVGERTAARGYLEANQIGQDGSLEPALGGGVCQAATTLFNAAMRAGCDIVERNPHSWPLYYDDYDWGLDAMVNWGSSDDMIFKNTTGGYLYLDFYFDYAHGKPSYVDIDIYGMPPGEGVTIELESVQLEKTDAPEMVFEYKTEEQAAKIEVGEAGWTYDAQLNMYKFVKKSSRPGYKFQIFRVWKKDGVEFKREELYTTTYEPKQGLTYTRTGEHMNDAASTGASG